MESKVTLRIKDPNLRLEYLEKRSKEIITMSGMVASQVIIISFIVVIISIILKWDEYLLE